MVKRKCKKHLYSEGGPFKFNFDSYSPTTTDLSNSGNIKGFTQKDFSKNFNTSNLKGLDFSSNNTTPNYQGSGQWGSIVSSAAAGTVGAVTGAMNLYNQGDAMDAANKSARETIEGSNNYSGLLNNDALLNMSPTLLNKVSWKDYMNSFGNNFMGVWNNVNQGASAGASAGGGWGALAGGIAGLGSGLFGYFGAKARAKRLARKENRRRENANMAAISNYGTAVANTDALNDYNVMANSSAYGGPINMQYSGPMSPFGNRYADGGIMIQPNKKGTFTTAATKHNMGVQEFANHVLNNKEDYSTKMIKKAVFAKNAANWHADGGILNNYHGDFSNGLTYINNGGTHEESPYEGVPMGADNNGTPNVVEEGEVIFNDYVFSNRLTVPNTLRKKYGLSEKKEMTFADAAKKLSKESIERPNDPISTNGINANLTSLQEDQEVEREKKIMSNPKTREQILQAAYNQGAAEGTMEGIQQAQDAYGLDNIPADENQDVAQNIQGLGGFNRFDFGSDLKEPNLKNIFWKDGKSFSFTPEGDIIPTEVVVNNKNYSSHRETQPLENKQYDSEAFWQGLGMRSVPVNKRLYEKLLNNENKKKSKDINTDEESPLFLGRKNTWMRYVPIAGAGLGIFTDLMGWTNKPDYSNANAILNAVKEKGTYQPVSPEYIGDYLSYNPFDRNYYLNKYAAVSRATRNDLINQSGGNRATAMAGIVAANANDLSKMGELARQAEEYNLAQRQKQAEFNRGTNQYNAQAKLSADQSNQNALANLRQFQLNGIMSAMQMRENARLASAQAKQANISNFLQGLGDLGRENVAYNQMNWGIENGLYGPIRPEYIPANDYKYNAYAKSLTRKNKNIKKSNKSKGK